MLEAVVGSEGAERVMLFIAAREKGYAKEIADTYQMPVSNVQKQLERMERDGLLVNTKAGRTRIYQINPRYAFKEEVESRQFPQPENLVGIKDAEFDKFMSGVDKV